MLLYVGPQYSTLPQVPSINQGIQSRHEKPHTPQPNPHPRKTQPRTSTFNTPQITHGDVHHHLQRLPGTVWPEHGGHWHPAVQRCQGSHKERAVHGFSLSVRRRAVRGGPGRRRGLSRVQGSSSQRAEALMASIKAPQLVSRTAYARKSRQKGGFRIGRNPM